ncbi:GGDEF domain-containing protein [Pelagerythrobacter marensis]|uniref:Putative signaling protein n=1 Tax=Pelagerythrobacter marensis TaxID=543877 RepID=A0A0G3XA40_9SPHN|nr:sensor domain-containing diguanylate cyclase [Pelagerythrobacter marensis]AKM08022.1 Putative signaling protein [Pelagerythrobacter marensis]
MIQDFTLHEGAALYGLLAEGERDIVLKLDRAGFVVHASSGIEQLGIAGPDRPASPHLADLAEPGRADAVHAYLDTVMHDGGAPGWFEFAARKADGGTAWFTLQLRPLLDGEGAVYAAVGIMRSMEERRALEERLFAASMTDPLTGLANRRAFHTMLGHLVDRRAGGSLALFDIGHLHPLWLRHGASEGDRIISAFADLLRALLHRDHILARIGDERFAVLMPDDAAPAAEAVATATLAELDRATDKDGVAGAIDLRASVGISAICADADETLRRAELALVHARARGRGQVERRDALLGHRRRA